MKVQKVEYILQVFEVGRWHGLLKWIDQPELAEAELQRAQAGDPTGEFRVDVRTWEWRLRRLI